MFEKEFGIADTMSDAAEGGAAIAWRLLATLEGGSLVLATSALLAYTARGRIANRTRRPRRPCKRVLLTNTTSQLGTALKRRLELHDCTVSTVTSSATSGAGVDALVVVGAIPKANGLNGISDLVTEDVYDNIKLLESLSPRVSCGGCIAWACSGGDAEASASAFTSTASAFDTVLQVSLQHVAKNYHCEPIWVGRCDDAEQTAERVVAALLSLDTLPNTSGFSIRNAAIKFGEHLCRWLKIIT